MSRRPGEFKRLQITRQKKLLKDIRELNLMVVRRTGASGQMFLIQVQPTLLEKIRVAQQDDTRIQQFRAAVEVGLRDDFRINTNGALYIGDRICVPKGEVRGEMLSEAHSSAYSIHPGGNKMYQDLKKHYWWNGMKREIA